MTENAQAARNYKDEAKKAMLHDGIDRLFLEDSHWAQMWSKHFERTASLDPSLPYDAPIPASFDGGCNLRVLQWNLLAEGLVPEGFLMPLVSRHHVASVDRYLSERLKGGDLQDFQAVARLTSQGHRSIVWRKGVEDAPGAWEDFATMACEMASAMKGLAPEEKEDRGKELKEVYNADNEGGSAGQLTINEQAVVGCEHRLLRVLWLVTVTQPDIIAFQELDNFEFMKEELGKMGYACGRQDATEYVPMKDRSGETYGDRLAASPWAFAPKWGKKRGMSTSRFFLEKRTKAGGPSGKARLRGKDYCIDDDGQAIFWRKDRLRIVGGPEFYVLPGPEDIDSFIAGTVDQVTNRNGDQGAVRVRLELTAPGDRLEGQQFFVCTTHLSSGTDAEVYRIQELLHLGATWGKSGLPEIWAMDANTELDFEDVEGHKGAMRVPMEANALQSFMQDRELDSVWSTSFDAVTFTEATACTTAPVSVWKMRGSASAQPKKVGEDMYQLIDHIFFRGHSLFSAGQQALRLREKHSPDVADRDWLALMPNELLPSDHLPIVWDFRLNSFSPRKEGPVLLCNAQQIWQSLVSTLPDSEAELVEEMERLLWLRPPNAGSSDGHTVPSENDVGGWLDQLVSEGDEVIGSGVTQSLLEQVRWHVISQTGRFSEEDSKCCILGSFLFSLAASVARGAPLLVWNGPTRPKDTLLPDSCVQKLALAALRYVHRSRAVSSQNRKAKGYERQLWGLTAQMTEFMAEKTRKADIGKRLVAAFDSEGAVTGNELDELLPAIDQTLANPSLPNAPALLALHAVKWKENATGMQVAAAVKLVIRAIEAGYVELSKAANVDPVSIEDPCRGSGTAAVLKLRSDSGLVVHHKSFDEAGVNAALRSLAESGNLDAGGGLSLLLEALQGHLIIVEQSQQGHGLPERHARAINRPPPLMVAACMRRAVVNACESLWPIDALLVAKQKLDVRPGRRQNNIRPNRSPIFDLVQALCIIPDVDLRQQTETFCRILRILSNTCNKVGPANVLPPVVHADGITRFKFLLTATSTLQMGDVQRWKTLELLTRLLEGLLKPTLIEDAFTCSLQAKLQEIVEEEEFRTLLLQRPKAEQSVTCGSIFDFQEVTRRLDQLQFAIDLASKYSGSQDG